MVFTQASKLPIVAGGVAYIGNSVSADGLRPSAETHDGRFFKQFRQEMIAYVSHTGFGANVGTG